MLRIDSSTFLMPIYWAQNRINIQQFIALKRRFIYPMTALRVMDFICWSMSLLVIISTRYIHREKPRSMFLIGKLSEAYLKKSQDWLDLAKISSFILY